MVGAELGGGGGTSSETGGGGGIGAAGTIVFAGCCTTICVVPGEGELSHAARPSVASKTAGRL